MQLVGQQPIPLAGTSTGSTALSHTSNTVLGGGANPQQGPVQARAGSATLAADLTRLTAALHQLAAAINTTSGAGAAGAPALAPAPKPKQPAVAEPKVTDAQALTNAKQRRDPKRAIVLRSQGHTLKQLADHNLALQGWGGASTKQVKSEAKRLGALNGIKDISRAIKGRIVVSDNGMQSKRATKLRKRLDAADTPAQLAAGKATKSTSKDKSKPKAKADDAPKAKAEPKAKASGGGGNIAASNTLTVKGKKMSSEQRKNLDAVLDVGKKMGAGTKVLEAAVATVIQESNAQNLNHGDRDSLGLFQQRPSMGWGTPAQVRDPQHAARKFFEQAIPADKKSPGKSITQLAQTVQRSGFPSAYQQWAGEASKIVAAWKSGN